MKRRDLLRHIEAYGCVFVREGQGHKANVTIPSDRFQDNLQLNQENST